MQFIKKGLPIQIIIKYSASGWNFLTASWILAVIKIKVFGGSDRMKRTEIRLDVVEGMGWGNGMGYEGDGMGWERIRWC